MDLETRLLSELVARPSVNPMGRPVHGPEYLEGQVTDYLEEFFRSLEVEYRRTTIAPGRDNIVAVFRPPTSRFTMLWDVHQDTVPVEGMSIPPFEPRIEGNRLYGRGSCDVKGAMAAMLTAFSRLVAEKPKGCATVILACTVDEEFTHTGSSRLATDGVGADLGIIAEPTRLNLVTTHKGAIRWKIRTRGVACHSSAPERGDNAIYRMAGVVLTLKDYARELSLSTPDPILGPPSLSVGRIEGGQSVNVVPDRCEIEIDRRVIPGETGADCRGRVESYLRQQLGSLAGIESLPPWVHMPPLVPRVREDWLASIESTIGGVTGRPPERIGVPFGTDAGPLSDAGLPCVVFGPGDIAQAHTRDEWVDLDEVRQGAEIYLQLARGLG